MPEPAPGCDLPQVALVAAAAEELDAAWGGTDAAPVWETAFPGLGALTLREGRDGDHLYAFDGRPAFHVAADAATVLCRTPDEAHKRFLLDTILWSLCLMHGRDALHASSVVWGDSPVAFAAHQGGGKTSLLAELLQRGRPLFSDDVVALERRPIGLLAHPGPPLINVPLQGAGAAAGQGLGVRLAVFDDSLGREAWTLVEARAEPAPLRAVVLLSRLRGGGLALGRVDASVFDLLAHGIALRHVRASQAGRFAALSDLVDQVPVLELTAGEGHSPAAAADLLERDLDTLLAEAPT